jgi:hypothetical protein
VALGRNVNKKKPIAGGQENANKHMARREAFVTKGNREYSETIN